MGKGGLSINIRVNPNLDNRPMKTITNVVEVRQNKKVKRRLRVVNESFEPHLNRLTTSVVVFQWPVKIINKHVMEFLIRSFINGLSR